MRLAYSTWGMPAVPIEVAVAHCAALGFDGLELTVIPGWTTDAATLGGAARRRIRTLYDDHRIALCGLSGNVPLLKSDGRPSAEAAGRFRTYLDLAAELQHPGERLIVTTTSGGRSDQWGAAKARLVEQLGALCSYAESAGVRVGIDLGVVGARAALGFLHHRHRIGRQQVDAARERDAVVARMKHRFEHGHA